MTNRELDEKIEYYYRNDFSRKQIAEKLEISIGKVAYRLKEIRKRKELKRWWQG